MHCFVSSLACNLLATYNLQVCVFSHIHPTSFGHQFPFPSSAPAVSLFLPHYRNSQFTISNHEYPQQIGDNSLIPPELRLERAAPFYSSATKVNKRQMELKLPDQQEVHDI